MEPDAVWVHQKRPCPTRPQMFDEMPYRDAVSWNTILSSFKRSGDSFMAFQHFVRMVRTGLRPTGSTLTTMITASPTGSLVPHLHAVAIRTGFSCNFIVGTALVGAYAGRKDRIAVRRAFDDIPIKNLVSWTSLIVGYMQLGRLKEAEGAFGEMLAKNVVSWTVMINGFIDNGHLDEARRCFTQMSVRNVVTWTSMIKGYQGHGRHVDALNLFVEMHRLSGILPNLFTYSAVLATCAGYCSLLFGKSVHGQILRCRVPWDVILCSSLVEMYGKCGDVGSATRSFESSQVRNVVLWNSIVGCYARNGLPKKALQEFERMIREGVRPDHITFVGALMACVHGGLVKEGERYFELMDREFHIKPRMEHYGCMVDLLGRAGQIDKAEKLIRSMPFRPGAVVWGALLGAYGLHSSLEHGVAAAESMHKLEEHHPAIYSMLLRIYGENGAWRKVEEVKETMEKVVVGKQTAQNWVESATASCGL
ncbi:unnamed protein product [Musa textilis]